MTDAKLKSLAARINRLLDEKQELGADIADIFKEAKSSGYVPKVLRKAITRQRMEPAKRQEEDSILELYEAALDGPTREAVKLAAQGATSREIESATGLDHSTVARSVALKKMVRQEMRPRWDAHPYPPQERVPAARPPLRQHPMAG